MTISANTLFHFTNKMETLQNILKTRFYPRFCLESCFLDITNKKWAIPMVCFCDIPLSNIIQHTQKYGNYAIGIKKAWAIEQGVSPILYVHEKSVFIEQCRKALNWSLDDSGTEDTYLEKISEFMSMFSIMKPYEGEEIVGGKIQKIRYYDEREWRYIRPISHGKFCFLTENSFNNVNVRNRINKSNEEFGVDFTPDVINYIIVERENEILPLINDLSFLMGNFPHEAVELLKSRILSMERIKEDF